MKKLSKLWGTLTRHIIEVVNDMGASCKGLCLEFKQDKIPNSQKYQVGQKRCSWCEIWFSTDEIRCPCCKMILRTKSRNKRKMKVLGEINVS